MTSEPEAIIAILFARKLPQTASNIAHLTEEIMSKPEAKVFRNNKALSVQKIIKEIETPDSPDSGLIGKGLVKKFRTLKANTTNNERDTHTYYCLNHYEIEDEEFPPRDIDVDDFLMEIGKNFELYKHDKSQDARLRYLHLQLEENYMHQDSITLLDWYREKAKKEAAKMTKATTN